MRYKNRVVGNRRRKNETLPARGCGKPEVPTLGCELTVSYAGKRESWHGQPRQRTPRRLFLTPKQGGNQRPSGLMMSCVSVLRDPMEAGPAGPASRGFCLCVLGNAFCSLLPWLSSGLCPWVPPSPASGSVMGSPGTADRERPQGFPGFIKPWRVPRTTGEDLRSSPHLQSGPEASAFCAWWVAASSKTVQPEFTPRPSTLGRPLEFLQQGQSKDVHCTDEDLVTKYSPFVTSRGWSSSLQAWSVLFLSIYFLLWPSLMAQW